ncbi:MAG: hypothetical protein EHM55_22890 [Acidobacteria bacterium]|nr:MAG: hypothetical protein EHM55_22890 [Acidobacteriota bacterium]
MKTTTLIRRCGMGAVLAMASVLVSAQSHPSHQVTNGEITATIYLPDAKNGFYTTTRFDWSGAIRSLKYEGHEYYGIWFSKITDIYDFGYEGPNKDVISADFTAMVGPAEEFGALGYNDVPAGGLFVKPGVGVLKRDEMNYNHSRPYVIANGGKWDVKTARDSVEFTHTLSEPSIGFGYVYAKVVRLTPGKPQMTISHVMRNTGSKPIATNVYNHNFTTIDMQPTGPDVEITVPWPMTRAAGRGGRGRQGAPAGAPGAPARQGPPPVNPYAPLAAGERMGTQCGQPQMQTLASPQGNKLAYSKVLEGSECYQASFTGFGTNAKDNDIRIENRKTGAGVRITGDRPVTRFGYWSIRTVVAPEPYIDINIEPGQQFAWTYTFDYYTTR